MENPQLSEFGVALLYIIAGIVFVAGGLITAFIIRPSRPNEEKLTTYESGEDPVGNAWGQFNVRFYIVALVFLLFDVELALMFPWATVFGNKALIEGTQGVWGWFSIVEMFVFVLILALGLAYAWAKGHLDWVKPRQQQTDYKSKIPKEAYIDINKKY